MMPPLNSPHGQSGGGLGLPSGRKGRAMALGLLAMAATAAWGGVADPLRRWYAGRQNTLEDQQALLARMHAMAAALPALQQRLAHEKASAAPASILLPDGSDTANAAGLQETVRTLSEKAGLTILSVETLPADSEGAYRRISLRLTLHGSWTAITAMLALLHDTAPRMMADDIQLHATAGSDAASPQIDGTMAVFAFAMPPSGRLPSQP